MQILLYISYGQGLHEYEVIFSILTCLRCMGTCGDKTKIVVYTDRPHAFVGLPITVTHVPETTWTEWSGPDGYNHRRKIEALKHALSFYVSPTVLVDGDTWWRQDICHLFARISPGHSVMHIREGSLSELKSPSVQMLFQDITFLRDLQGNTFLNHQAVLEIWNAGVIGLHPSEAGHLDRVLSLIDFLAKHSKTHIIEQFSVGYCLKEHTKLVGASDVIFHYWPPYLRRPFRGQVKEFVEAALSMETAEAGEFCFRRRPRPNWFQRGKVLVKKVMRPFGFFAGRTQSNDW